jgi:hypothetical protein
VARLRRLAERALRRPPRRLQRDRDPGWRSVRKQQPAVPFPATGGRVFRCPSMTLVRRRRGLPRHADHARRWCGGSATKRELGSSGKEDHSGADCPQRVGPPVALIWAAPPGRLGGRESSADSAGEAARTTRAA